METSCDPGPGVYHLHDMTAVNKRRVGTFRGVCVCLCVCMCVCVARVHLVTLSMYVTVTTNNLLYVLRRHPLRPPHRAASHSCRPHPLLRCARLHGHDDVVDGDVHDL
jgi:hypothetical protein